MHQHALRRALYRESAQNKGPRGESQVLGCSFSVQPDELNRLGLAELPFRNHQLARKAAGNRGNRL